MAAKWAKIANIKRKLTILEDAGILCSSIMRRSRMSRARRAWGILKF